MSDLVPQSRPQLPAIDVRKILAVKGCGHIPCVLAIRGYYRDSMGAPGTNDRGIYDDAMFVALNDHCVAFNANTDPSAYRDGMATLVPGQWAFVPGIHGISHPDGGYPAFRQGGKFTVTRDGQGRESGTGFAINLHRGGNTGTSSLGCQTIPPVQWDELRELVYKALGVTDAHVKANPNGIWEKPLAYLLIERAEVEQILGRSL